MGQQLCRICSSKCVVIAGLALMMIAVKRRSGGTNSVDGKYIPIQNELLVREQP